MPYIGHNPTQAGSFVLLDDIASGFDGNDVTFTLQIGSVDITPTADNLIIALDGVIQHSPEAYTVSGSTLTFDAAPASGVDFYGMLMGQSASIGQGAIGADELAVTGDGSANQMLVSDGDGTMTWKGSGISATSATGDIIYRNSSGELARLAVGSAGQVLTVASGVPAWETDVESYLPLAGGTMTGALNMNSQNITNGGAIAGTFTGGLTGNVQGNLTGNVTGNTSGTAATVTGAAQTNITSVGTLAGLTVSKSSGWAAEFYQTAADQHGVGIHVGNNTSNNSAFEVQNSAESVTYFKVTQKGNVSLAQSNGNIYGLEVYHSSANTSQPANLIWGNSSGNTQAIVRIHENATRSNLATNVFEVLGTSSNTELFKVRADGNTYFTGQGTFYDNLNVVKSSSATMTIRGNAANANASLTFMEQTTTMWEIRGDGGASDKLSFIDTGGAEVLSLAQDSNATFGGWVYVNNRVMGASGDIRVGSNDGNEMLHLLADGTAKIDTAGTTALTLDSSQNATFTGGITQSKAGNLYHIIEATGNGESTLHLYASNDTGDAFIRFRTGASATSWCIGVDNSDSDQLKIARGNDPHSSTAVTFNSSGNATFAGDVTLTSTHKLTVGNSDEDEERFRIANASTGSLIMYAGAQAANYNADTTWAGVVTIGTRGGQGSGVKWKSLKTAGGCALAVTAGTVCIGGDESYQKLSVLGGNIYMSPGYDITWANGNAVIGESSYELQFDTYNGSALTRALTLAGNNAAYFTGQVGIGDHTGFPVAAGKPQLHLNTNHTSIQSCQMLMEAEHIEVTNGNTATVTIPGTGSLFFIQQDAAGNGGYASALFYGNYSSITSAGDTTLLSDESSEFSSTKGTSNRTNVYIEGYNNNIIIQNNRGTTKKYTVQIIAVTGQ